MKARVYEFEGEKLTVAQVRARWLQGYAEKYIRNRLNAGCLSRADVRAHESGERARHLAGAKRGAATNKARGFSQGDAARFGA